MSITNVLIEFGGGGTAGQTARIVPEFENYHPEPYRFGVLPSWGGFVRHVKNFRMRDVELRVMKYDMRPAIHLEDVTRAEFDHLIALPSAGAKTIVVKNIDGFAVRDSAGLADARRDAVAVDETL